MNSDVSKTETQRSSSLVRSSLSGLSGGLAACTAKTIVAPLDRVKILFQTSNPDFKKYSGSWTGVFQAGSHIYRVNGVRGLFQGHSATLLRIFPYAGIKFMAYEHIRQILIPNREHETNFRRFVAGALCGMTSVSVTYPLEVIRVRMAFHTNTASRLSFSRAFSHIYHETTNHPQTTNQYLERFPLLKLYRGFTPTFIGMIPYAGISFLTWDILRASFHPAETRNTFPVANFAIGAISGLVAQTASYPFQVIRRRMQVGGLSRPDRWLRWGETVQAIWSVGGWRGFYVGLSIGYLKIVPMTAISFAGWQAGKTRLGI